MNKSAYARALLLSIVFLTMEMNSAAKKNQKWWYPLTAKWKYEQKCA